MGRLILPAGIDRERNWVQNVEGGTFWKSILTCYCGADMSQDESHHSRYNPTPFTYSPTWPLLFYFVFTSPMH